MPGGSSSVFPFASLFASEDGQNLQNKTVTTSGDMLLLYTCHRSSLFGGAFMTWQPGRDCAFSVRSLNKGLALPGLPSGMHRDP